MIQLAFTAEGTWARHASAMLHSALSRTSDVRFNCYVMYADGARPDGLEHVDTVARQFGASLQRLPIPLAWLEGFPTKHFHRAAWYRILLPRLLPEVQRVLYLDADIIVTDDLRPLWETDLGGALFAAATNPLYPFMPDWPKETLGVLDPRRYINSGVLLLDLRAMRDENVIDAMLAYARSHPENTCPEQDALSALYHDRLKLLHPRWNVQNTLFDLRPEQLPFSIEDIRAAKQNPAVIHFIAFKPWEYVCAHPLRDLYHEHLAATPWPPAPLEGRTLFNHLLYPLPIRWRYHALRLRANLRKLSRRLRNMRRT